jgi:hypothetical protein
LNATPLQHLVGPGAVVLGKVDRES